MKFTKEELEKKFTADLSNNGKKVMALSTRSLGDYSTRLYGRLEKMANADELELADVVKEYLPDLESLDGNVRKDNSDFIKKWKEDHPEDGGNGGNGGNEGNGGGNATEEKIAQLLEEFEALKAEREADKKEKAIEEKRKSLKEALKAKKVEDQEWIDSQLDLIHIDAETDVDSLTEKLVSNYNKYGASTQPSVTPGAAGGSGKPEDDFGDVLSLIKRQNHRE